VIIHYTFDRSIGEADQIRMKAALAAAIEAGDVAACKCSTIDAWVYETRPPDFQASISCSCDAMRPLYSSTPDTDD